jgi:hypothetical protein
MLPLTHSQTVCASLDSTAIRRKLFLATQDGFILGAEHHRGGYFSTTSLAERPRRKMELTLRKYDASRKAHRNVFCESIY